LALGFGNNSYSDELLPVRPDKDSFREIYGRSYTLSFEEGRALGDRNLQFYDFGQRRLSGVSEVNMLTGRPSSTSWNCSRQKTFMIVRPQDLGAAMGRGQASCPRLADSVSGSTAGVYRAIRNVLRAEDWWVYVDPTSSSASSKNNCVVPRATGDSCYDYSGSTIVNYHGQLQDVGSACGVDASGSDVQVTIDGVTYKVLCPEYVTVCTSNVPG
jgi:hypothetical protein